MEISEEVKEIILKENIGGGVYEKKQEICLSPFAGLILNKSRVKFYQKRNFVKRR